MFEILIAQENTYVGVWLCKYMLVKKNIIIKSVSNVNVLVFNRNRNEIRLISYEMIEIVF